MYKAGDGTGEDGLCIDIVGWHAVKILKKIKKITFQKMACS